jgi:hypothetical protein
VEAVVISWVAAGCVTVGVGEGGALAASFLPQPAAKTAVPKTSSRHKPAWFVAGCQTGGKEPEKVFI